MKEHTEDMKKIKQRLKQVKEKNLLPRNYATEIATKLGIDRNKVYRTMSGKNADMDIIEMILEIAEDNKEKLLLARFDKLLED